MMPLKILILGLVQGLTEFLPVSSTGHMIIVEHFLKLSDAFRETFFTVIQLGSILAVVLYFRKKLLPMEALMLPPARKKWFWLWVRIMMGVIPSLVIGALWGSDIQERLYSVQTVAIALFIGGVALVLLEHFKRKSTTDGIENLSWWQLIGIGCAQCVAMIPGVSRSAATILGALGLGASRETAVEYSFFLAIPTMFAATGYSLLKHGASLSGTEWGYTLFGLVVAFASSWSVIAFLMNFIRKRDFKVFGYYRIVLGLILFFTLR